MIVTLTIVRPVCAGLLKTGCYTECSRRLCARKVYRTGCSRRLYALKVYHIVCADRSIAPEGKPHRMQRSFVRA